MLSDFIFQFVILAMSEVFSTLFVLEYTKRRRFKNFYVCYLIDVLFHMLPFVYNCFINKQTGIGGVLVYVFAFLGYVLPIFVISKDSLKRKVVVAFSFFASALCCEFFVEAVIATFFMSNNEVSINHPTLLIYVRMFATLFNVFEILSIILIHRRKRYPFVFRVIGILALLPLTEFIHIWILFKGYENIGNLWACITGMVLMTVSCTAGLSTLYFLNEAESIRRKEEQYQAKLIMKRNDERYLDLVQSEIKKTSVIRHDIANQIQQIELLLAQHTQEATDTAGKLMLGINDKISELQALNYCSNTLINTILTLENSKFYQNNIKFKVNANVPQCLNLADITLSSLLTNMLDNALEAAFEYKKANPDDNVEVSINMGLVNGRFVVKTVNPTVIGERLIKPDDFVTTKDNSHHLHGYGIKILSDIAENNNGDFSMVAQNNMCEAVIAVSAL